MKEKEYIQSLLDKFLEGETTEVEERELSTHFTSQKDIPEEWRQYLVLFKGFKNYQPSVKSRYISTRTRWIAAASVVILVGIGAAIWMNIDRTTADLTPSTPVVAQVESENPMKDETVKVEEEKEPVRVITPAQTSSSTQTASVKRTSTTSEETVKTQPGRDLLAQVEMDSSEEGTIDETDFMAVDFAEVKAESQEVRSALLTMNTEMFNY